MSDIVHDYDSVDRAAAHLEQMHTKLSSKKRKLGDGHERARAAGRGDKLGEVVSRAATTALQSVEGAIDKLAEHASQASKGLRKTNQNHREHDERLGQELQRLTARGSTPGSPGGSGGSDRGRPKYYIHDDGRVQEIKNGKLHDLDPKDKSGIHDLVDPKTGKAKGPSKEKMGKDYHAAEDPSKPNEKVTSKKISTPTELSGAVEEARRAEKNYGGKNYASLHYQDTKNDHDFILVGRSSNLRSHSERSIGKPLLDGKEGNVRALYTERAPCQATANCERWLERHFKSKNADLEVSHGVEYDSSLPQKDRDWAHKAYLSQLKQDHAAGNYGGTMGSHDFDAQGAQNKAAAEAAAEAKAKQEADGERPAKRARKGK
ncbi:nucleic acid/nucleotide deaminase domain-containing protein [Kitasatospora phosalacinea]|uniref:nucleic acid/nucleotide deaminase domain-containing protein n=1 Tax=Kitasatospora phosalacinea TaxID=2065 RepID=UPI0035E184C9